MRPRRWLVPVVAIALLASAEGRGDPTREDSPSRPAPSNVRPTPSDSDLVEIRDIFRYADEPVVAPLPPDGLPVRPSPVGTDVAAPPQERSRLIGLVQRSGRSVAAVFIDGEVLLLGEGESAQGFTVLDIREEAVRLRDPEGNENTLELP